MVIKGIDNTGGWRLTILTIFISLNTSNASSVHTLMFSILFTMLNVYADQNLFDCKQIGEIFRAIRVGQGLL